MAGLTSTGLEIKRLQDVVTSINTKLQNKYGSSFVVDPDSVAGVITGIFSNEVADLWEGLEGVYLSGYRATAEGISLNNAAFDVGVTRLAASNTFGYLKFTGNPNATVPKFTVVTHSITGLRFQTLAQLVLSTSAFTDITLSVNTVATTTTYSLVVSGVTVSYTSGGSTTAFAIVSGLQAAIASLVTGVTATVVSSTLVISVNDQITPTSIVVDSKLTANKITSSVQTQAEDVGPLLGEAGKLTSLLIPIANIDSVTNPFDFTTGRNQETDSELRARTDQSLSIIGTATPDAIRAKVRNLPGVTNAFVIENKTLITDGDGRPGKSFEVVVEGGVDQDIAQVIWDNHPTGIESYGTTTKTVKDSVGNDQTVKFSRPTKVYIHFALTYTLYSEETFPVNGNAAIKQAMYDFGILLDSGQDVILQRFLGPIYSNVPGLAIVNITAATSTDGITPGPYTTDNISIAADNIADFSISRISIS